MKFLPKLSKILENHAKRKTYDQLRQMSERQLIDCGYSPDLLNEGVKAWPWRELPESIPPLRFDQTLKIHAVSKTIEIKDTPTTNRTLTHKDAA